ncbi:hypothetical protein ACIQRS_11800 [Streptomyces termitum]|uniref:hypothetical protein n=1 Tax=Streptomyces termitum TaxID=67368 RepID=UPI001674C821|nr:hypothetical protein [Streptomyces termitum]
MALMRRGLVHALAWSLATGAAVTLSWWGVHTVLSGTVYDAPRALPLPTGAAADLLPADGADDVPLTSSTHSARPAPPTSAPPSEPPEPTTPPPTTRPPATAAAPDPTPPPRSPSSSSRVKTYAVDGGRVTFDVGGEAGELVSATPASGWQMRVWKQTTWIRVSFTRGDRDVSVFCLWHDSPPRVQIEEGQA